jgi:hypothetical protein
MNKRQQIHKALKAAKPFLSKTHQCGDKEEFICHALERLDEANEVGGELATEMIMERIGLWNHTLENWIRAKIGNDKVDAAMDINRDALQQYRHRWLNSMIAEFSK